MYPEPDPIPEIIEAIKEVIIIKEVIKYIEKPNENENPHKNSGISHENNCALCLRKNLDFKKLMTGIELSTSLPIP